MSSRGHPASPHRSGRGTDVRSGASRQTCDQGPLRRPAAPPHAQGPVGTPEERARRHGGPSEQDQEQSERQQGGYSPVALGAASCSWSHPRRRDGDRMPPASDPFGPSARRRMGGPLPQSWVAGTETHAADHEPPRVAVCDRPARKAADDGASRRLRVRRGPRPRPQCGPRDLGRLGYRFPLVERTGRAERRADGVQPAFRACRA